MVKRAFELEKSEEGMRQTLAKNEKDMRALYATLRIPKMCQLFHQAERKKRSAEYIAN